MSETLTRPAGPVPDAARRPGPDRPRPGAPLLALWTPEPGVTVALARIDHLLASPPELARLRTSEHRAAAAMAPWRGREHLAGRALLRLLLAAASGEDEARRPVAPEPAGRPRLAGRPATGISVSHSGGHTAAAVARGLDVGVDVQTPRPPSPGMLRRCCPPPTAARLASLAPAEAAHAFARVWTVQEACVKARGTGLAGAPWRIPADPDAETGSWQALRWTRLTPPPGPDVGPALVCAFGPPVDAAHPPAPDHRTAAWLPGPTPPSAAPDRSRPSHAKGT
ncbi:4'-phosphopantetheinyl transferase superfamily protein [Streptomyces sp. ODS05-4]|uniref:4'-phosphopantetheinyl transferase family protein n=1 Tax=Streptomyces sp. ODS05-4 TaxID=2944939 RepID=UPI00210D54E3|nr:4'-phosphopantetheinyl transferase superfamily protein [Streptomyces sp. ODS05-4]